MGYGDFDLLYIRTLEKEEVDFIITKNNKPRFIVEAKYSAKNLLNPFLIEMHSQLKTQHAFQVCFDMPYVGKSCFDENNPIIVPAKTFLSQLI